MGVKVEGISSLDKLNVAVKKYVTKEVGKDKGKFAKQAARAIVNILPVWSGATQNSIIFSDGSREVSPLLGYPTTKYIPAVTSLKYGWLTKGGHWTHTAPLGQGWEVMANKQRVLSQASNVNKNELTNFYITSNSRAENEGDLWEGRAGGRRNPKNSIDIIITESIKGTRFKQGK